MSLEEKKTEMATAVAHAFSAFAQTPFPYLLGCALLLLASHWDGHLFSQKNCYELKELNGKTYKLNTCTGEIVEAHVTPDGRPDDSQKK